MSIATVQALDRVPARQTIDYVKAALALQASGTPTSFWLATSGVSLPAPGVAPTAAAICSSATTGAIQFVAPISGQNTYVHSLVFMSSNTGGEVDFSDRLGHMGGLDSTLLTAQTVSLDISVATSNLVLRKGASDYSEVQWFLEWYVTTGVTAQIFTVAVTYGDGTTDTITVTPGTSNIAPGRMFSILPNAANKWIKSVQSVTCNVSSGTAGNFGVSAYRVLTVFDIASFTNFPTERDWTHNLCRVHDSACLVPIAIPSSAGSGSLTGEIHLVQG